MIRPDDTRLDSARAGVVLRWEAALRRISERDEGGTLEIANSMDEFCAAAARARALATGVEYSGELRCRYCPIFANPGDCLGFVGGLNHAVLNARWDDARRMVEDHLREIARVSGI